MKRAATVAMLATPALSFGTLAVALGLGAHGETLAAVVYGAPPGADRNGLAWQVDVMLEDRGVREIKPNLPVFVHAEWKGNARDWTGVTTDDGAAEVPLDFPGIAPGDDVDLSVTVDDEKKTVLARGRAHVPMSFENRGGVTRGMLAPIGRDGSIVVDVAILGGAIAAEFLGELWVRAQDHEGKPLAGAQAHVEPVDGLSVITNDTITCANGFTKLEVLVKALSMNATIRLKSGAFVGSWNGALPIVLGATRAYASLTVEGNYFASVGRPLLTKSDAYVEINDAAGRIFGAAVPLTPVLDDFANARIDLPKLSPGIYWIVAGSDPRAAETLPAGTFATPFRVGGKVADPCDGDLATMHATGFARSLVIDGFLEARQVAAKRRHRGMSIAFAALALGAIVEAILLLRAARSGSNVRSDHRASTNATWISGRPGAIAIGIGLSLLGFALFAAFIATH